MNEMLNDAFRDIEFDDYFDNTPMSDDSSNFYDYMEDASEIIYSGCKLTKLGVIFVRQN